MNNFDPSFVNVWLTALETENLPQTRARLRDLKGFCCLGVACHKADLEYKGGRYYYELEGLRYSETNWLPLPLQDRLGLQTCEGYCEFPYGSGLADRNDRGETFPEIAALLRRDLLRSDPHYFKPEAAEAYRTHFNLEVSNV